MFLFSFFKKRVGKKSAQAGLCCLTPEENDFCGNRYDEIASARMLS